MRRGRPSDPATTRTRHTKAKQKSLPWEDGPMAWETTLLRKTSLKKHPHCLDTLDAYADIVPIWQRICLFLYAALGTWLATQFGIDMTALWTMGELGIHDI